MADDNSTNQADDARARRKQVSKEQTKTQTRLRPGIPRPTAQWSAFGNKLAPTSLNSGAHTAAEHITDHFHSKYTQTGPRLGVRLPMTARKKTTTTTDTKTTEEATTSKTSNTAEEKPAERQTETAGTQTPFGESRVSAMEQGAGEQSARQRVGATVERAYDGSQRAQDIARPVMDRVLTPIGNWAVRSLERKVASGWGTAGRRAGMKPRR